MSEDLYRLAQTRHGTMLYNPRDIYIGASIERYGEFSYLEAKLLVQLCGPGDTVIDVGANIGAHTIALSKRVGPEGFVYAFEPQRVVFQLLCANVALNGLTNVECVHAVCGPTPGEELLPDVRYDVRANFGSFGQAYFGSGRRVRRVTLDDYAEAARIALVKIDVEGMESAVIAGAGNLIGRHRPLLYVENDRPEKSPALIAQILALGYRLYWHLPPLFNPSNWRGEPADLWGGIVSVNMLCIPRECKAEVTSFREITSPQDRWDVAPVVTTRP
jgi:FkbM family methyltransferase